MKTKFLSTLALAVFAIMLSTINVSAADVVSGSAIAIDETNFPDEVFREYVSRYFDIEGDSADGYLSEVELGEVQEIDVSGTSSSDYGITSLKGIEFFTNLTVLQCRYNANLLELDVSANTALERLTCSYTGISELDVSENTALTDLDCVATGIIELDVSENTKLYYLSCARTEISELNISANTALAILSCYNTKINKLDVSKNTELITLSCYNTEISKLDVSANTALKQLRCHYTSITELDVSKNTALEILNCNENNLGTLDVSNNLALKELYCGNTKIESIDVSNNTELVVLDCSRNRISTLDLSSNLLLEKLDCRKNALKKLDISKNTALKELNCKTNSLVCIDLSANTALESVEISDNWRYIAEVDCSYEIVNTGVLEGFDVSKASDWYNTSDEGNVTYKDGKLIGFEKTASGSESVYYTYDCGNGITEQFHFGFNVTGEHNYEHGVCADCGDIKTQSNVEIGEEWVVLEEGLDDSEEVHLLTYAIYNSESKKVGTIEFRSGKGGMNRIWITTTDIISDEIAIHNIYSSSPYPKINIDAWEEYFPEETYTYAIEADKILDNISGSGNITWDEESKSGVLVWNHSAEAEKRVFRLYRDGKQVASTYSNHSKPANNMKYDFADDINESGTYTVTVVLQGGKDTGNSEVITSDEYVYVKPAEVLGITDKVWWTAKDGETLPTIINWNPVAGAGGYQIKLIPSDGSVNYARTVYNTEEALNTFEDFSVRIKNTNLAAGEELTYTCTIRALAGDIEIVGNSSFKDIATSGDYVLEEDEEEIKATIDNSTADTVIDDIQDVGIEDVANAMQNNQEILDKVEDLEKDFADENNIEVLPPAVEHPDVEDEDIKVVGAGLNAESGKTIKLAFAKLDKNDEVKVNNKLYKNTVQVNISLKEDEVNVKGELKTPITITMKPPKGVNLKKLVILHYLDNGEIEHIYPRVNDDGTVTFSVTSFSTFAFANMVHYDENGGEELPEEDGEDDDTPNNPVTPDNPNKPTIPDTPGEPNEPSIPDSPDNDYDDDYEDDYDDYYVYNPKDSIENRWAGSEGWQKINNKWYFFNNRGKLRTGWVQDEDASWYYMDPESGSMATGWVLSPASKLWYYMDTTNGHMLSKGWICDPESSRWYYLDEAGAMCTGWICTDGTWYYLDKNGAMCSGWNMIDGHWYLMNNSGAMLVGWQTVGGKEYYLEESGKCLLNTTTPDGHKVDEDGAKIE